MKNLNLFEETTKEVTTNDRSHGSEKRIHGFETTAEESGPPRLAFRNSQRLGIFKIAMLLSMLLFEIRQAQRVVIEVGNADPAECDTIGQTLDMFKHSHTN